MHDRRIKFLSEKLERDIVIDDPPTKWVPKKKHEVLKAKYKCLKKLFQIYDAGVMGMIPPTEPEFNSVEETHRKHKRSHKPKTDSAAGTSEICLNDDLGFESYDEYDNEKGSHVTLTGPQEKSYTSTQIQENREPCAKPSTISKLKDGSTQDSQENLLDTTKSDDAQNESTPNFQHSNHSKRKKAKFKLQSFIKRLFGVRPESCGRQPFGKYYNTGYCAKRKRGPLRIKGQIRSRLVSESGTNMKSPEILSCVQLVQKDCLADTTPRRCPVVGCEMTTYGIINYNDHLNIAHFPERKHICNYCHKGFENEEEKIIHENEHIGINKLRKKGESAKSSFAQLKSTSVTQTDPQADSAKPHISEDKLNKIINFIEKIPDPDRYVNESNNKHHKSYAYIESRNNIKKYYDKYDFRNNDSVKTSDYKCSDRKVSSCGDIKHKHHGRESVASIRWSSKPSKSYQKSHASYGYAGYELGSEKHRIFNKKSNTRSMYTNNSQALMPSTTTNYPAISNQQSSTFCTRSKNTSNMSSYEESIAKESCTTVNEGPLSYAESLNEAHESEAEVSYDASTNMICYTSKEPCPVPPSAMNSVVKDMKNNKSCYNWEPSKKVIRV